MRNSVLRNTYWLLALSMIPTVLGAFVGVSLQRPDAAAASWASCIFMAIAFGFIWAIEKTKDSARGRGPAARLHLLHGPDADPAADAARWATRNGGTLIMTAFGGTAGVFAVMASIATTTKRDFSGWATG